MSSGIPGEEGTPDEDTGGHAGRHQLSWTPDPREIRFVESAAGAIPVVDPCCGDSGCDRSQNQAEKD